LELNFFEPGALCFCNDRFHRLSDPWRQPRYAFTSLVSSVGTLADKLRVARLRRRVCLGSIEELFTREQTTTAAYLSNDGFSTRMVEQFFRPFLGGIFLEQSLSTSSRMFEFVFRMFAAGVAALPSRGIGAIPHQMADRLPADSIRLNTRVQTTGPSGVTLESGESIRGDAIVIAVSGPEAQRLLRTETAVEGESVTCVYFDAPSPPVNEPILVLNGTGVGPVNNLCVPSNVSSQYAPDGRALISASVLGCPAIKDEELVSQIQDQLNGWFGDQVQTWRHLRTYRIEHALPRQSPEKFPTAPRSPYLGNGLYICGDHCEMGSVQGALASGQRAARAILQNLSGVRV
jgi:phytoene dehydrogenase-like protein